MTAHTVYRTFETESRREFIRLTDDVQAAVDESGIEEGMALVAAMHITAAVVTVVAGIGAQGARHLVGRLAPARRGELVEPFQGVLEDARLVVVDPDPRGDVHGGDERHALLNA
jgi:hypothetical protein